MSTQLELRLLPPNPSAFSLNGYLLSLMSDGEWRTPYQMQKALEISTGLWHSDSAVTARIRDLRKPGYGAHNIVKRKREGSRSYEYRIEQ